AVLLLFVHSRAAGAAQLLAVPGAAWLIWHGGTRALKRPGAWARLALPPLLFLAVSGLAARIALAAFPAERGEEARATALANHRCPSLAALAPVGRLPAGLVFTFADLGPRLVVATHHDALAGPYHRNEAAILAVHRAFRADPAEAERIVRASGARYLLICPDMSESTLYRADARDGFYMRLAAGERFAWLEPVELPRGSPLMLWRIRSRSSPTGRR
ncbi:MAG: AcrB/AcrD/AcrF family protein, partial [Sphingomonadaceae bacterium]